MRLVATLTNTTHANEFSYFLTKEGIENQIDTNPDNSLSIWIIEEDEFHRSSQWYEEFAQNPNTSKFLGHFKSAKEILNKQRIKETPPPPPRRHLKTKRFLTFGLIGLSALFYLIALLQIRPMPGEASVIDAPLYHALLFDDPKALQQISQLHSEYTDKELKDPSLAPETKQLLRQAMQTPYWRGFYHLALDHLKGSKAPENTPLASDLFDGQIWRLFTPALLHGGLFHLIINAIWLLILGTQVEQRLRPMHFLLLVLMSGILSNIAQYLMGGPLFFGLSGIVCALLAFIWMRQRLAPWEGYLISRPTIMLLTIFILGMAGLQVVSFLLEIYGKSFFRIGLANTAHIVGGLSGLLMGRLPFFSMRDS